MPKNFYFRFNMVLLALASLWLMSCRGLTQKPHTPPMESEEGKSVLNALRIPVEVKLKQKITFDIFSFKVVKDWAFLAGRPLTAGGQRIDYTETPYEEAVREGHFEDGFTALLRKSGGLWKVVHYSIGDTGCVHFGWDQEFGAPRTILGVDP